MRKIFIPVLMFLMLISFVSCNLDNNGILWTGVNRYPSDDKDRNFIGYSETTDKLYYTTVDGLSEFDPANKDSNSEHVISGDDIFINNSHDRAWISGNKIVYINDYVPSGVNINHQDYYIYNLDNNSLKKIAKPNLLEESESVDRIISTFVTADGKQMLIGSNGDFNKIQIFEAKLDDSDNLNLTTKGSVIENFVDELNGLVWFKKDSKLSFKYLEATVTFYDSKNNPVNFRIDDDTNDGNQIRSVAVSDNKMTVLRYYDGYVYIYEGELNATAITLKQVKSISEDLSTVPSFINDNGNDNKLYFLKYNSARSSELYIVNLDDYSANRYTTEVAGLRAEAFFLADGNVFILTKDKGVFRIDETGGISVTPVPDLRRR